MRKITISTLALCLLAVVAVSQETPTAVQELFEPPVRLTAGDAVIDVSIGHADPFVCDFNGDGKQDLLVGQFGGGKLLFFANTGSNAEPKLAAGEFVQAGEGDISVPSG